MFTFKMKTNGFDHYEFIHDAATEVELDKISFETKFFKKKINYPFHYFVYDRWN